MSALRAAKQLSLPLSQPINHHERLHHDAHGAVLYWEAAKSEHRWTKILPGDPVEKLIAGFSGANDTYLSVNQFFGWRNVRLLRSLRCCYADIDGTEDLDLALEMLQEAQIPAPSFVVFSGRGLHLYWLLTPTPCQALPVWQLVEDHLVKSLRKIGADIRAKDCARMLRVVGTTNAKNGQEVRGLVLSDTVWTMHELANEVLGYRAPGYREPKPAKVFDFGAASARQKKPVHRPRKGSIYQWWHLVYRDLITIADHHWFGGIPPGHRDNLLFLMSVALSWFARPETLKDEIERTAKSFTPTLTDAEVETQMAPVLKRAAMSAQGKTIVYDGQERDARYHFKAESIRTLLRAADGSSLIPEELYDRLRALAPADVIKQRKKERDAKRYEKTREEYLKEHSASADQRAVTARLMHAQGKTPKEIATELGVSKMSVSRYLRNQEV